MTFALKHKVTGVGSYTQTSGSWAKQDYMGDQLSGPENTFYHLGCSLTALTNVVYWAVGGKNAPTPGDANKRNEKFLNALEKLTFRCLVTEQYLRLGGRNGADNDLIYSGGTHSDISVKSSTYSRILRGTINAIARKNPVLLSYRGCIDGNEGWNHSVVAIGVDNKGSIFVSELYGHNIAYLTKLSGAINIEPCRFIYKAFECLRK